MMRLAIYFTLVSIFVLVAGRPAAAQNAELQLEASLLYGSAYTPETFEPVKVRLINPTDRAIVGTVALPEQPRPADTEYYQQISVPPHSEFRTTLFARFKDPSLSSSRRKAEQGVSRIGVLSWRASDGQALARADLLGIPTSEVLHQKKSAGTSSAGQTVLLRACKDLLWAEDSSPFNELELANEMLKSFDSVAVGVKISADNLPRHAAGYSPCRVIVLDQLEMADLDILQRDALVSAVQMGATLIISSPRDKQQAESTGVRFLGRRYANSISSREMGKLEFNSMVEISEAIPTSAVETLVSDEHFVHVAAKRVGRGRIVFTSFPINALSWSAPNTKTIWQRILPDDHPSSRIEQTLLTEKPDAILRSMIGLPAPPWLAAAGVSSFYVLLAFVLQVFYRGARRPRAYLLTAVIAIIGCAIFVALASWGRSQGSLQQASISTIELGYNGGIQRQITAFFGVDDDTLQLDANHSVSLRPLISNADRAARINLPYWATPSAGVRSRRVERVWQAIGPSDPAIRVSALATFDHDGLQLDLNNSSPAVLSNAVLSWNHVLIRLEPIRPGKSVQRVDSTKQNAFNDFAGDGTIASELSLLRNQIAVASRTPASIDLAGFRNNEPVIVAWLDNSTRLLETGRSVDRRSQTLVQLDVRVMPIKEPTSIHFDWPFITIEPGKSVALVRDPQTGRFADSTLDAPMLVGLVPPAIGLVRPRSATLTLNLSAQQYAIRVERGLCNDGNLQANLPGKELAVYNAASGAQSAVKFSCSQEDFDSTGTIWLRVIPQQINPGASDRRPTWRFNDFQLSVDADVSPGSRNEKTQ